MNKKYLWLISAVTVLLLTTIACSVSIGNIGSRTIRGSGVVETEQRDVSGYSKVELSGIGRLVIEVGENESLTIEAEDNLMEYIETDVRGSTLQIGIQERISINPSKPIIYYLTVRQLEAINVSGAGSVEAPDLEADRFSVDISGAGGVKIDRLVAARLDVNISGLGDMTINGGQVDQQDVNISGSGNHETRDMESAEADISLSGLGNATVWVTEYLKVGISGAGSVRYAGNPTVDSNVSGLGSLRKITE
jgi:hypothetical protein